jgi:hypothetical protein
MEMRIFAICTVIDGVWGMWIYYLELLIGQKSLGAVG